MRALLRCVAAIISHLSLRVIGSHACKCPLYPRKRTFWEAAFMSARCQNRLCDPAANMPIDLASSRLAIVSSVIARLAIAIAISRLTCEGFGVEDGRYLAGFLGSLYAAIELSSFRDR